jgi:hypothetical protein
MSPTGAVAADDRGHRRGIREGRSAAQWYCLLAGVALTLAGIFGFLADATFDTTRTTDTALNGNADGALQGDTFLGFEVNGWHNLVHLASGLFLLAMFRRHRTARPAALLFGVVYGTVTVIGMIDGNDVLGFMPVNAADNILHLALSALGIIAGLLPFREREEHAIARGNQGAARSAGPDREERFARSGTARTGGRETVDVDRDTSIDGAPRR